MSDNSQGSARNNRPPVRSAPFPFAPASNARRRWLIQAGALASSASFPLWVPRVGAQAQSTLNALPRVALVIGNTKYVEAPLKNPGNDAKGIAGALQQLGFQVNLRLDAGRNEMIEAIRVFGGELAKKKGVGMFYYAGHGAQLAWKNYLIPVDAIIEKVEDMQAKTVELNSLLDGLIKAQNPMNVIILDACRDNPFGTKVHTQARGLSQFDAPPGSLLAYATSPGNTAGDGEGANGLYTENLLRELKVPEAKIEDVFKRVRLNVRRKSEGQQIPWESTSLEEDFYFLPPAHIRKLSEAEIEKAFNEELAVWEKIKDAKEPGPLEDYLRKNPSGRFSELAQFQLDRVLARQGEKKIEAVSAAANPFTKGTARVDTNFKIGDSYSYREIDLYTKLETRNFRNVVTEITDNEVIFNNGVLITDLFGNIAKLPNGNRYTGAQFFIPEYSVGKKWTTRFKVLVPNGATNETEYDFKVTARETIVVPAGTFDTYRVEGQGWVTLQKGGSIRLQNTYWISPGIRRTVANEIMRKHSSGKVLNNERMELTAYSQK
jgi:hypothetical protein